MLLDEALYWTFSLGHLCLAVVTDASESDRNALDKIQYWIVAYKKPSPVKCYRLHYLDWPYFQN